MSPRKAFNSNPADASVPPRAALAEGLRAETSPAAADADADSEAALVEGMPVGGTTRERLVGAAMELILEQGFTATSVAQILQKADARSGSLYHFFPTKEDLLLAVLERYQQLLWPIVIQPVFDRISDPVERIFGVLDGYRQMLTITSCARGCPIGNLALELSDSLPGARELIADNFDGWKNAIRQCLDDASGRLPADVDRAQLASFVLTVMEGGIMQAKTYRRLEPFNDAVTQLRDYFDRLLADGTTWSSSASPSSSRKSGHD